MEENDSNLNNFDDEYDKEILDYINDLKRYLFKRNI